LASAAQDGSSRRRAGADSHRRSTNGRCREQWSGGADREHFAEWVFTSPFNYVSTRQRQLNGLNGSSELSVGAPVVRRSWVQTSRSSMMSGLLPLLAPRTSTMPNPRCVCPNSLDRCDRCDLLLDFPSLHLVAVTQAPSGLLLEVESCGPVTGCAGCGVIATGHGRVMVEMIDAPWAGRPVRIRWRKRRWICLEDACEVATFVEQDPEVCAPRGLLSTRAIRWAIGQLRREGATIQGLARQLGTTWNPLWSPIQPVLARASQDPARFEDVRALGVDEPIWHHCDPRRRGPKQLTGIVALTRRSHPTARLLVLVSGRSGTVYRVWLDELREEFRDGIEIATLDPFQGYKNAIDVQPEVAS